MKVQVKYLILVFPVLLAASAPAILAQPMPVRAQLKTEEVVSLYTDMLAKGLTQDRSAYIRRVLSPTVEIRGHEMPQDSAVFELRKAFSGRKVVFPASRAATEAGLRASGAHPPGMQFIGMHRATVLLEVSPAPTPADAAPPEAAQLLTVGFARIHESWAIISLDWGKR